jgi:hypothetical protein
MLEQFATWIRALEPIPFAALVLGVAVVTGVGFFLWKKFFQHARVMEDMPTSKVRSAAQGFVELTGIQHELEGAPLSAPLTGAACTWWEYKIEKEKISRDSKGRKQTRWVTVESDTSVGFFTLRDDTGEALVNPRGADVTASLRKVWYGHSRRPLGAPSGLGVDLGGGSGVHIKVGSGIGVGIGGRYRYTERIMRPGEPIYALGHFETWSNAAGKEERAEQRSQILAEWKANPSELVKRFDEDGDGEVDMEEWEQARRAAAALVEEHVAKAAAKPDVDVLMKPEEADHPFILSTKSQEELTKAYRWKAAGSLVLFLMGVVALGWTLTARFGG